ncbi:hypothetical protein COCSUDRAFT_83536 [Coccomyxa subellipsoidea C-169]|uniref:Uncharacterized protein n=1 Tax=Coccomyxa subellipsoidea (strain C-169) TaxID=574566 RepID=I0YRF8_COCSC|nr:hypothetical protein COCSUDRAFT_83536 [Coccomyxa subellipsoidea C-169]EIE20977.1 hypothetical protein COCSUDRAFT_83536 [Coccomyxa subellipsoidea C-169]|eukprot:XP_005645521.1 hypothetical protein COCSUDRAFT_83536 [Coccomyxa subellipsoidea C-169]
MHSTKYGAMIDTINEAFVTARDEIEYAKEALLDSLEESERSKLQRSMGLKMEQLKAELEVLDSLHA